MSYSLWNTVQYALQKLPVQIMDVSYAENVVITLTARKTDSGSVLEHLRNLSDGKLSDELLSENYQAWDL
jgi:putative IMPACT (imprinted ancient) family translation regulator